MGSDSKVAIGCDNAAFDLKETLRAYISGLGFDVEDVGIFSSDDTEFYPDIAVRVAHAIDKGRCQRGVLICGTGIGMAISANKVPGIRAAQAHDTYSAERARKSNDAHIVTLGARVVGPEVAKQVVRTFLESEFQGGRSTPKVERIKELEQHLVMSR